jgi:hypothetical protein
MKRTLIIAALFAATFAAGSAGAQTLIVGSHNVQPPPGGIANADVMITSAGAVQETASVAQVVGAATDGSMTAYAPPRAAGQSAWAQRRIEESGYRNVRNVGLRSDGRWYGTATRGNREVAVVIDGGGNVAGM